MPDPKMSSLQIIRILCLLVLIAMLMPPQAMAGPRTTADPSDAPPGTEGETDIRSITWDVGIDTTTLTVSVDQSTFGASLRAELGVDVLIDTDGDAIADAEVMGARNADGVSMDMAVRTLDGTGSTASCQELAGSASGATGTVATTIAASLETFSFTFANDAVAGDLTLSHWVAFGQSPKDASVAGPWDYLPNSANPDPGAGNPGDRRCGSGLGGLRVTMTSAIGLSEYELKVVRSGTGLGSVSSVPAGIACGTNCTEAYDPGTLVRLVATPSSSSVFSGWSGACSGTGACRVTMSQARSVVASFKRRTTTTLSLSKTRTRVAANGEVSPAHDGSSIMVRLLKKKNGIFVKLVEKHPTLNSTSHYRTSFGRRSAGTCRVVSRFSDADHAASSTSRTFSC